MVAEIIGFLKDLNRACPQCGNLMAKFEKFCVDCGLGHYEKVQTCSEFIHSELKKHNSEFQEKSWLGQLITMDQPYSFCSFCGQNLEN